MMLRLKCRHPNQPTNQPSQPRVTTVTKHCACLLLLGCAILLPTPVSSHVPEPAWTKIRNTVAKHDAINKLLNAMDERVSEVRSRRLIKGTTCGNCGQTVTPRKFNSLTFNACPNCKAKKDQFTKPGTAKCTNCNDTLTVCMKKRRSPLLSTTWITGKPVCKAPIPGSAGYVSIEDGTSPYNLKEILAHMEKWHKRCEQCKEETKDIKWDDPKKCCSIM